MTRGYSGRGYSGGGYSRGGYSGGAYSGRGFSGGGYSFLRPEPTYTGSVPSLLIYAILVCLFSRLRCLVVSVVERPAAATS
jgi:uncharacterized membrane protein